MIESQYTGVTPESSDALESQLFALGAVSVELCDAADQPLLEPPPGTHPLWDEIVVKAVFIDETPAHLAAAALQAEYPGLAAHQIVLEDQDWVRRGLEGLHAMDFGNGLWVVPSWEPDPDDPKGHIVRLDPGLAFGTGTHPTTALCLQWLGAHPPQGLNVLDYGCGSGILAVAAARLGAAHVDAWDIDPQAVESTRSNAARNGFGSEAAEDATSGNGTGGTVRAELATDATPHTLPKHAYDLILANILAKPLIDLAPALIQSLAPGGRILLTGLLEEQIAAVSNAYRPLLPTTPETAAAHPDGWVLLEAANGLRP